MQILVNPNPSNLAAAACPFVAVLITLKMQPRSCSQMHKRLLYLVLKLQSTVLRILLRAVKFRGAKRGGVTAALFGDGGA